jgi:hypothetical protein
VWATQKAAGDWKRVKGAEFPYIESLYIDKLGTLPLLRVRYQLAGSTHNWHHAWADPTVCPDARGWLEARLGPLAGFEAITARVAGGCIALAPLDFAAPAVTERPPEVPKALAPYVTPDEFAAFLALPPAGRAWAPCDVRLSL